MEAEQWLTEQKYRMQVEALSRWLNVRPLVEVIDKWYWRASKRRVAKYLRGAFLLYLPDERHKYIDTAYALMQEELRKKSEHGKPQR